MLKRVLFIAALIGFAFSVSSCSSNINTIGKLAYDSFNNTTNTIYVLENGEYVPFIVLTNDYNGNTLLLRRDVLPTPMRVNEYSSLYEDSEIDTYLNSDYYAQLDTIQIFILSSEIIVTEESALGVSGTETKSINRKIFLLSLTELNQSSINACVEGGALDYFKNSENRIVYSEGVATSWWLRTPVTYYLSVVHGIGPNGTIGSGNAHNENGIRPAFCVPSSSEIAAVDNVIEGQTVYVFSQES